MTKLKLFFNKGQLETKSTQPNHVKIRIENKKGYIDKNKLLKHLSSKEIVELGKNCTYCTEKAIPREQGLELQGFIIPLY